ncbi:polyketide cyclase [Candidatus Gracilibacteria bacterium]|nr:polyketide cyclase [Candidatus Gracilibacteria bacterium]
MTRLTVSTTVNNSLEKVWESFWKSEHIVHWCFASDDWHCPKSVSPEPAVGVIFSNTFAAKDGSFSFDLTAQYTEVVPMKKLVYTMGEMKEYFLDAGRVVELFLEETPEGIKIIETFDAEDIHSTEQQIAGWQAILDNFKKYTETI